MTRDVLVSCASVAGPMLAYWLREHGFRPVVVERTPAIRAGLGGHAVDLFGPAVDVAAWTGILDDVEDLYLDSISQVRMPTWSRGRVTLVGDAGFSPGAAVGGGTTLAVVSAYVLAGELAAAGGDHTVAFGAYERRIRPMVEASWRAGQGATTT